MKTFLLLLAFTFSSSSFAAEIPLEKIRLPPGFKISLYAKDVKGARSMAWGEKGILFVGSRGEGKVYAIKENGEVIIVARDLNMPNGVAFLEGNLYVAEIHRILRFNKMESNLLEGKSQPKPEVIATYPSDDHHGWKFMGLGPDQKLYVPQGAPCNICEVKDPYGTITTIDKQGKNFKVYARGIRNSVGFDWHPITGELWFTDNGRDHLGDDVPSDELNRAPKADLHFGYPYCHSGDILDPQFGKGKKCADYQKPEMKLGAHVAALGMRFYTGKTFPPSYFHQIFIAEHGSWNRSKPIGYRLALVTLNANGHAQDHQVFAEGWLQKDQAWGRPVDVLNAPDGSLLVSDDEADAIYKIQYEGKK